MKELRQVVENFSCTQCNGKYDKLIKYLKSFSLLFLSINSRFQSHCATQTFYNCGIFLYQLERALIFNFFYIHKK